MPSARFVARNLFLIAFTLKKLPRSLAVLIIIAATFLVYGPALRNGFVWDDTALVLRDPLIRSWRLIPEAFRHFLFLDATASDFYRPLQRLTFTADYALYGFDAPWGWHLTSILAHAAAAVALFFLACRIVALRKEAAAGDGVALVAAVIWAIHPIFTSAVTYVAGRADSLAALCGFVALTLGLRSLGDGRSRAGWLAALCFLGALLAKENGVVALLIWFLILVWRGAPRQVFGKWLAIAVAILGVYLGLRLTAERTPPPASPPTTVAERPILAARAVAEYARLLVAPLDLRMERDVRITPSTTPEAARLRHGQTLAGALLIAALGAWAWRSRRRRPEVALCLAAFGLAYLPVSNVFSLNATVAEHWLYIPGAFLLLAAVLSLGACLPKMGPALRGGCLALAACWIVFLGVRTALQQGAWRDQRTFLETTVRRGGDSARMHINLANLESSAGNLDAARAHYAAALERAPKQPMAWFGVANLAIRSRDFTIAHEALDQAGASAFLQAEVLQSRAVLDHLETGRDSGDLLWQAVEAAPKRWPIRKRWIAYLDECGRTPDAVRELSATLEREPFRAESWRMLAGMLEKQGRRAGAEVAYEEAARRDVRTPVPRVGVVAAR